MAMNPILTLLTTLLFALPAMLQAADSRPNIVFLFTDDQTVSAMGCYGNKEIITPHMDKLAADGVRFRNHYNSTSICMASRASVMTGLYEYRHGCNFSHGDLERRLFDQSYPVKLRQAGYYTGFTNADLFHLSPLVCMKFRGLDFRDEELRTRVTEGALANYVATSDADGIDHGLQQRPLMAFAMCYIAAH